MISVKELLCRPKCAIDIVLYQGNKTYFGDCIDRHIIIIARRLISTRADALIFQLMKSQSQLVMA
jgi:hypothetical protein